MADKITDLDPATVITPADYFMFWDTEEAAEKKTKRISPENAFKGQKITAPIAASASPEITAGTVTFDCAAASVFNISYDQNVTTSVFDNLPSDEEFSFFVWAFQEAPGGFSHVWPAAVMWPDGLPTSFSDNQLTWAHWWFRQNDQNDLFGYLLGENIS